MTKRSLRFLVKFFAYKVSLLYAAVNPKIIHHFFGHLSIPWKFQSVPGVNIKNHYHKTRINTCYKKEGKYISVSNVSNRKDEAVFVNGDVSVFDWPGVVPLLNDDDELT